MTANLVLERLCHRRQRGIGPAQEADGTFHGCGGDLRALFRIKHELDETPIIDGVFDGIHGAEFPEKLRGYDIIVAGRNFGCGSAREQASTAIKGLGIRAVVAASFARTFYRNAINDGLTIVECPEVVAAVSEGDNLSIDLVNGLITHGDRDFPFPQIPASVRKILELGGLANYLKANLSTRLP